MVELLGEIIEAHLMPIRLYGLVDSDRGGTKRTDGTKGQQKK